MCGLAGRFQVSGLPPAPGWTAAANERLAHRGPDGSGCYSDDWCDLVHRRLALIDLTPTGRQPMANEDGTVWVAFNGEIYNHRELRTELASHGHQFRGTSDTEVLVHLYEEHGDALVHRLRGIFAFAIYDRRRRRLLLTRDRFGVKPLYHTRIGDQWLFASEIKALLAYPALRPRVDRQACYDFLGLGYIPEPATGFEGIHALPKGSSLVVTPDAHWMAPWFEVEARPDPSRALPELTDVLEDRLLNAVRSQAAADVPVAALLSGGIDSSLVVAAYRRAAADPPTTFNVRFPDPRHDETASAQEVAAHCGTEHHIIEPPAGSLTTDAILDVLRHFDQPFADTSCLPMYWVAAAVRERGIICTLSGDGGDEAFGGYARFWRANQLVRLMGAPAWLRQAALETGRALAPMTQDWGRQLARAVRLSEDGTCRSSTLIAGLANYLTEDQKAELVLPAAREGLFPSDRQFNGHRPEATRDLEELSRRITETLFDVSLPADMLRKVDMMSMRAGIEVRVPLLDEDVVSFGLSLPHRQKTDGTSGKLLLRALAARWLPRTVATRPKHGFSVPLDVMAPPDFSPALDDLLCGRDARTRPLINGGLVRNWLRGFAAARDGYRGGAISRGGLYQRVFTLLALELWLRDHALSW